MNERKQDLRTQKTELLLQNALYHLLKSHSFSHITVNDICIEAMVSRSAFYKHFEDKYALLRFSLNEWNDIINRNLSGKPLNKYIYTMLEHLQSERTIFRNIIESGSSEEIWEIMLHPYLVNIEEAMLNHLDNSPPFSAPVQVAAYYHASGIVSIIRLWIEKNLPYSVGEMACFLEELLPSVMKDG